jgi:hypothetical protein
MIRDLRGTFLSDDLSFFIYDRLAYTNSTTVIVQGNSQKITLFTEAPTD